MNRVAVIGIGNISRGDDAAGILAVRQIREELPGIHIVESSGDITGLWECFQGFDHVYIVDAISSKQVTPGRIHEFDTSQSPLPQSEVLSSSHAIGLSQAIELARAMGALPERLLVFGVEGSKFAMGDSLSESVRSALKRVVSRIIEEIKKGGIRDA